MILSARRILIWFGYVVLSFCCTGPCGKVVIYHGSNRDEAVEELRKADVVITTYSIVEAEYRRETSPRKVGHHRWS